MLCDLCPLYAQSVIYVDASMTASGDGSSWSEAIAEFQVAIDVASEGDTIWVRSGIYRPSQDSRDSSYIIDKSLHVYGGFIGTESHLAERPEGGLSVFDSELGNPDSLSDNRYTMLLLQDADQLVLDGFHFVGGHAGGSPPGELYKLNRAVGSAIMIQGSSLTTGEISIQNCDFQDQWNVSGGCIYMREGDYNRIGLENCSFRTCGSQNSTIFTAFSVANSLEFVSLDIDSCSLGFYGLFRIIATSDTFHFDMVDSKVKLRIDSLSQFALSSLPQSSFPARWLFRNNVFETYLQSNTTNPIFLASLERVYSSSDMDLRFIENHFYSEQENTSRWDQIFRNFESFHSVTMGSNHFEGIETEDFFFPGDLGNLYIANNRFKDNTWFNFLRRNGARTVVSNNALVSNEQLDSFTTASQVLPLIRLWGGDISFVNNVLYDNKTIWTDTLGGEHQSHVILSVLDSQVLIRNNVLIDQQGEWIRHDSSTIQTGEFPDWEFERVLLGYVDSLDNIDMDSASALYFDDIVTSRLRSCSPLIDAGYPIEVSEIDFYGNPRVVREIIDIGPEEVQFPLGLAIDSIEHACYSGQTGEIHLDYSGIAPIELTWTSGSNSGDSFDQLDSGLYTIVIRDASDCRDTVMTELLFSEELLFDNLSIKLPECHDDANGSLFFKLEGGVLPYEYVWSDGSMDEAADSLLAGDYSLRVTDSIGCIYLSDIITLDNPPELLLDSAVITHASAGELGQIELFVSGGIGEYSYDWSHGDSTRITEGLSVDEYEVTVTDENNCSQIFGPWEIDNNSNTSDGFEDLEVKVVPNPTTDFISIGSNRWRAMIIYDALGRVVHSTTAVDDQLDVSEYPSGSYLLSLMTPEGKWITVRFIKL